MPIIGFLPRGLLCLSFGVYPLMSLMLAALAANMTRIPVL